MNKLIPTLTRLILSLIFSVLVIVSGNSQPIIKVHGNTDKTATKRLILECLNQLEVQEDFHLIVRYSKSMSRTQPGQTFYQHASDTDPRPIIWVWIKANLNRKLQRNVLVHEMIHVKQFAKGELIINHDQHVYWNGEKHQYDGNIHSADSPWEFEAHKDDGKLAKLMLEAIQEPWLAKRAQ